MNENVQDKWHRGSRFYMIAAQVLWLSWLFAMVVIFRAPTVEFTPHAIGMLGGVFAAILTGSAVPNMIERTAGSQSARLRVEAFQSQGGPAIHRGSAGNPVGPRTDATAADLLPPASQGRP